jgi:hypothetical protein
MLFTNFLATAVIKEVQMGNKIIRTSPPPPPPSSSSTTNFKTFTGHQFIKLFCCSLLFADNFPPALCCCISIKHMVKCI